MNGHQRQSIKKYSMTELSYFEESKVKRAKDGRFGEKPGEQKHEERPSEETQAGADKEASAEESVKKLSEAEERVISESIVKVSPNDLVPEHEVLDEDGVEDIADSMRAQGFTGPPIVTIDGNQEAMTGVHRIAAAVKAGIENVPTVDIMDILPDSKSARLKWRRIRKGTKNKSLAVRKFVKEAVPENLQQRFAILE